MATAFSEAGTHIPGEQLPDNDGGGEINVEAEARKFGWRSREELAAEGVNVDPSRFKDADEFYSNALEKMPIARATIKRLSNKIDALERSAKQASDFFSKAEERAYQRAIDDIRREQEAAVEAGDIEAHRAAAKKLDALEKPTAAPKEEISPEQRAEEFADWGKENKWYATNAIMQAYADSQAAAIAKAKDGAILERADLDAVAEKVRAKFPDEFEEGGEAAPKPKRGMVEGAGNRQGTKGGKTYADLPPEARAMCDKWVKNGTIKSRDDYVKSYSW